MKKILMIILLCCFLLCSGCDDQKEEHNSSQAEPTYTETEKNYDAIDYDESDWYWDYWKDAPMELKNDVVPDKETAIELANVIYNSWQEDGRSNNYTALYVSFDTKYEIWIVTFSKPMYTGGYSIALQKKDGKVLKMWRGE